jgi:predicted ester cyclase
MKNWRYGMKKLHLILPLALILSFMVGCQDREAMAELEAMKVEAALEEQNKELIREMAKLLDAEGISSLSKYVSSDCVVHYPGGMEVHGLEAIIEGSSQFNAAFPDMTHTIEDIIAEGDKVAIRYTVKMTHTGEFQGIPPTGNQVTGSIMEVCRIQEGKIAEWWQEADYLSLFMQLGMELKLKESEK